MHTATHRRASSHFPAVHRWTALGALAMAAVLPGAAGGQDGGPLTLDRYLDWEWVSDPRISPDGRRIVYTRQWVDAVNDRKVSAIWIMDADGGRNRTLLEGSSPVWSPDGTRIAYLAPGDPEGSQIWVRWMDAEGATTQITRLERAPSNLEWSPDGQWIAFSSAVEDEAEFAGVKLPDRPSGAKWTEDPKVVERASYKRDRRGYTDTSWTHLFVVPAEGGTPRRITDGYWNHSSPRWSPDGTEIYTSSLRVENPSAPGNWYESEVYAVDVATGTVRALTSRRGPDGNPVPSPDGRRIAYTGVDWNEDTYRNQPVWVMDRDGSNPRQISGDFDRRVANLIWAPDGSGLYFNAESEGSENVYFVSVNGGVRPVTEGAHVMRVSSVSDDGTAVGFRSDPHEPGDLYRFDLGGGAPIRLTDVNADVLHGVALGEVEEIWYPSTDGFRIQGWIVKPPDFDPSRRYPLMLAIHGGPHAMYDVGFSFAFQEHAAHGYVVLYTNPRGSTGYGSAFANAIQHAYPGPDMDDLMAGVDAVLARGYVDEDNLFVYGCSGGGILTTYIVGNTDRFRAASANCPIVNWMSAMGTSDAFTYTRTFEEYFWENPTEWMARSSIFYVGNVTTPTMLMTGERDLRTPMGQTEEFYQALQILGVPTVMVRFQDEWHGTGSKPSNFMRTQLYLRKWWEKWGTHEAVRPVAEDGPER